MRPSDPEVAVIYSGGTDSTCVAAMMAQEYRRVHLLTYHELATRTSPYPTRNIESLRNRFPNVVFVASSISVDKLVRHVCYDRYLNYLARHRFLSLATCGFSTLSWHVRTLLYCLENQISDVVDGLTRELMHFPGHMDEVVELFRQLYLDFGIRYRNPVREWETPADQQFIDRMIVNLHGTDFIGDDADTALRKTTGRYLHGLGILPHTNVKGSHLDKLMQHDCYPFALYNILTFWGYLSFESYPVYCQRVAALMRSKIEDIRGSIEDYRHSPETAFLGNLIEGAENR